MSVLCFAARGAREDSTWCFAMCNHTSVPIPQPQAMPFSQHLTNSGTTVFVVACLFSALLGCFVSAGLQECSHGQQKLCTKDVLCVVV